MRWMVEECDNALSSKSIRVVSDNGETIATGLKVEQASLISAAPELLSALKAILANHEMVGGGASIFQCPTAQVVFARQAVAKAEKNP